MPVYYSAGAPYITDECPHRHRTPDGAQRCIDQLDRAIRRVHGPSACCARVVMAHKEGRAPRVQVP